MSLDGMDISISYSSSFMTEEKTYKLRQFIISSKIKTGHSILEHDNMLGQRVVLNVNEEILPVISINDDSIYSEIYSYFETIDIKYSARAIKDANKYIDMNNISSAFYSKKRELLSLINNNTSINKKLELISELESLAKPDLNPPITIQGYRHMLSEENSLTLNKWTNGPYYDIALNIVAYKELIL